MDGTDSKLINLTFRRTSSGARPFVAKFLRKRKTETEAAADVGRAASPPGPIGRPGRGGSSQQLIPTTTRGVHRVLGITLTTHYALEAR